MVSEQALVAMMFAVLLSAITVTPSVCVVRAAQLVVTQPG